MSEIMLKHVHKDPAIYGDVDKVIVFDNTHRDIVVLYDSDTSPPETVPAIIAHIRHVVGMDREPC